MWRAAKWPLVYAAVVVVWWVSGASGEDCSAIGCCYDDQRTALECSFTKERINVLLKGAPNLQEARIIHGQLVYLRSNAVGNTEQLRNILFTDIRKLTLEPNNQVQVGSDRAISLEISQVGELRMDTSAFFGWESNAATLSIRNVERCHIAWAAFPARTIMKQVLLENVTSLTVDSGALQATIEELVLRNVTISSCVSSAFGGSIAHLSLSSVTVGNMESRCLDADRGWTSLTVISSDLGHMSGLSIRGAIDNVSIVDSGIASAGHAGFRLDVVHFTVETSTIGELSSDGMKVRADQSISLQNISVSRLRENAFRGFQITDRTGYIAVSWLAVNRAEAGSLRFADGAAVSLHQPLLIGPCVCSTPDWAHQLVSGHDDRPDNLSTSQQHMLLQQVRTASCSDNMGITTLLDFTSRRCGRGAESADQHRAEESAVPGWWFHLGVASLTCLLLAVAALLLIACLRYRARRRQWRQDDSLKLGLREVGQSEQPVTSRGGRIGEHGLQGGAARTRTTTVPSADYCQVFLPDGTAGDEGTAIYSQVVDDTTDRGQQGGSCHQAGIAMEESMCANVPVAASIKQDAANPEEPMYANIPVGATAGSEPEPFHQAGITGKLHEDAHDERYARHDRSAAKSSETNEQSASVTEFPMYAEVDKSHPSGQYQESGDRVDLAPKTEDIPEYAEITLDQSTDLGTASEQFPDPAVHLVDNALYGFTM